MRAAPSMASAKRARSGGEHVLVSCHIAADGDALGALAAASVLWPHATLVWPGTPDRLVQRVVDERARSCLPGLVVEPAAAGLSCDTLVLVDTAHRARVAPQLAPLLAPPHPRPVVVVLDHHAADAALDVDPIDVRWTLPWGSASAIGLALAVSSLDPLQPLPTTAQAHAALEDALRTSAPSAIAELMSAEVASLILFGIHCDTRSFTLPSTTACDLLAASLLQHHALPVGPLLAAREPVDSAVVRELAASLQVHQVGQSTVGVAVASSSEPCPSFSAAVQHCADAHPDMEALFGVGAFGKSPAVVVVGRARPGSRMSCAAVCRSLGGGGHHGAAAATLKGETLVSAREKLFAALLAADPAAPTVADLMTSPPVCVSERDTVAHAAQLLLNRNVRAAVVVCDDESAAVCGAVDRAVADRALRLGRGATPVRDVMTELECVRAADAADRVVQLLLRRGSTGRLVAVVDVQRRPVGVVSRSDVVSYLSQNPAALPHVPAPEHSTHVMLEAGPVCDAATVRFLRDAGALADECGVALFVVGGFPRDVLLQRANDDIDLVVSGGEGVAFARRLHERFGDPAVALLAHEAFHTAVVTLRGGAKIDVATARLEYYPLVAALPVVELSSLKMDLARRDFTMNALAIQLNKAAFGTVIDFFHSRSHISSGTVSVLHPLSFVEDPTRIFRALRFVSRYRFQLDGATLRLLRAGVAENLVAHLTGSRLFHELHKMLGERDPTACFELLHEHRVLHCLHPQLQQRFDAQSLESAVHVVRWYAALDARVQGWKTALLALCWSMSHDAVAELHTRLLLPHTRGGELVEWLGAAHGALAALDAPAPLSVAQQCGVLRPLSIEVVLLVLARMHHAGRDWAAQAAYITHWRHVRLAVTGDDLKAMGLKPGPAFRELLARLLDQVLDGHVSGDREAQLQWVRSQ